MATKYLTSIDLTKNELQNARIQNLASAPSSPVSGQQYYDTTLNVMRYWSGSAWVEMDAAGANVASVTAADTTLTVTPNTGAVTAKVAKTLDHTYVTDFDTQVRTSRLDQLAVPSAAVSLNSQKITNLLDPTAAQDAATKAYVDLLSTGVTWKKSVKAATTTTLPANTYSNGASGVGATLTGNANGALAAIDGYTPGLNDRILVKNEATAANDGIYSLTQVGTGGTPYILTRVSDMDQAVEIEGAAVLVENGTVNLNQGWIVDSAGPYTMGTTAITFTQFTGVADITAGTGLTKTGNTMQIDPAYVGQSSITTLGTIATGVWNGTTIAVLNGGTGATTAAGARTNLGATTKFTQTIGDGSSTSIAVTHNLGTQDVIVQIRDASTNQVVDCDITNTNNNTTTFVFAVAPATNAYKVVIVG